MSAMLLTHDLPNLIDPVLTRLPSRDRILNGRDLAAFLLSGVPDDAWRQAFSRAWMEAAPAIDIGFEMVCESPRLDGPTHGILLVDMTGLLDMLHVPSGFPAPVYLKRLAETCAARVNTEAEQQVEAAYTLALAERATAEKRLARLNSA